METCSLEMECFPDELSPIQMQAYEKAEKEHNEIREKLNNIMRGSSSSENIFSGNIFSAYQLTGLVTGLEHFTKAPATIRSQNRKIVKGLKEQAQAYKEIEEDDEVESLPLAHRVGSAKRKRVANISPPPPLPVAKSRGANPKAVPKTPAPIQIAKTSGSTKPGESNAVGGLTVGVKNKQVVVRIGVDAQEMSFNKLQGKTYPSLVVFVRPTLIPRDKLLPDRPALDAKVKTILMYPPDKFTEWLIQQGLVRSEQLCPNHGEQLNLGLYSDVARFPYSGGYVWISQCCQNLFTSVFNGSIFESSSQNPSVLLKLIYHWSVQTNIQNVVQWVKVDNLFIKEFFTQLRAICTASLYTHTGIFGGPNRKIEVGVISLGTSSSDGAQRQVKVEVLGIYDPQLKAIRLRAIEPLPYSEKVYKKRFLKILEPLVDWVHEESTILTDLTVDKATLHNYGFRKVVQSNPADVLMNPQKVANSNITIMDYLRRVVPRMFQNTLSLLNRPIIQQFLDELVWREFYGNTPNTTFDAMLGHIAEQTRITTKDRLNQRLTKMASNPFKNWSHLGSLTQAAAQPPPPMMPSTPSVVAPHGGATKRKRSPPRPSPAKAMPPPAKAPKVSLPPPPPTPPAKKMGRRTAQHETTTVESHFFGIYNPPDLQKRDSSEEVVFEIKCPECELTFVTNLELQDHLYDHVRSSLNKHQCRYCFNRFFTHNALMDHIMVHHKMQVRPNGRHYDVICEREYSTHVKFASHLTTAHYPSELPFRCGACAFASSSRRITIDHFYEEHGKSAALCCMLCLQVFVCANREKGVLMENVNAFLAHIRGHKFAQKTIGCPRCTLVFLSEGRMRAHMYMDHVSMVGEQLVPIGKSTTTISIPTKRAKPLDITTMVKVVESTDGLTLDVPNGQMCLECDQDFDAPNHMVGLMQCNRCEMRTHCLTAMMQHTSACIQVMPVRPLGQQYFCVCHFSTDDGNLLAKHLGWCNKQSAYPSSEAAAANVHKENMLDQLGLVRKEKDSSGATTLEGLVMELVEPTEQEAEVEEAEVIEEVVQPEGQENESYLDSTYDPNLSLVDLAPAVASTTSSVIVTLPRDEYKDLATPQVPEHHLMEYGEAEEQIIEEEVVQDYQTY